MRDRVPRFRYNRVTVTINTVTTSQQSVEIYEVCDRLQKMGYARSKVIRIYGQEFEVVSDPFPEGDGIAVRAFSKRETQTRTLKLPLPVLQTVTRKKKVA